MKKEQLNTETAPAAIGPYSQAIGSDSLVFVSGQLPICPKTGGLGKDIKEQTRLSLENIRAILASRGLTPDSIVKTTVFMTDLAEFGEMNEVYAEYFKAPHPARSTIQIARLPKDASVEIECIAIK